MMRAVDDLIDEINTELDAVGLPQVSTAGAPVPRIRLPLEDPKQLAAKIEHTQLRPSAGPKSIVTLCAEATEHDFYGVCVHPIFVEQARALLTDPCHKVITVIGFPFGATLSTVKAFEATNVLEIVDEFDMVLPIARLINGDYTAVYDDIRAVVEAVAGKTVKVILETAYLSQWDKVVACLIAIRAGASFLKTSTGFAGQGATIEDIQLMRHIAPEYVGIKAAGGIKTLDTALQMLDAGANRLGCSSSVDILREVK